MDIHQSHIDAFLDSTHELFETMIRMPVVMEVSEPGAITDMYDLSGTVQITGDIVGSVTIGFECDAALKFAEQLLGAPVDAGSVDFADAVGEISNIIVGSATSKMKNISANIGCPEVAFHDTDELSLPKKVANKFIFCTTDAGNFLIKIFLHTPRLSDVM